MIAVVGAGIAGVMSAYFLKRAGAEVLLIDRASLPAQGASGAAGAFISPKIGKSSALHDLTNEAFNFAYHFYKNEFPNYFHQTGILRVPKNSEDENRFEIYEAYNYSPYERWGESKIKSFGFKNISKGFYFPEAGDVDAQALCEEIVKELGLYQMGVKSIKPLKQGWRLYGDKESIDVEHLVLATGYESNLLDISYMGIRGLWGSRGDYETSYNSPITIHKDFTLSSTRNSYVKIGATHMRSTTPCMICNGRPLDSLELKAKEITKTDDFRLIHTLCGMRSTSRDSFPIVGKIIDVKTMLEDNPQITKGAKAPLVYHKNISILNGLGGRGFVFAPLLALWLSQNITKNRAIDPRVNPDRLFWKWVRRIKKEDLI